MNGRDFLNIGDGNDAAFDGSGDDRVVFGFWIYPEDAAIQIERGEGSLVDESALNRSHFARAA